MPFGHLRLRLWRLQAFLALLVAALALLPPCIFFILEIGHLRDRTQRLANHFARTITEQVEKSGPDIQALSSLLQRDFESNGVTSFQLIGETGREILRLGRPDRRWLDMEVVSSFASAAVPLKELRLSVDDRPLLRHAARVFSIHLLVATVLAFIIFKIAVQSLRRAVDELESIQAQLIHTEKLSAIGEIYAGIAHEINNPLGIILTRVHLLQEAIKERQIAQDFLRDLEMIQRHGSRIAEVIRGLLAFARSTSFEMTETDLNLVIDETVSLLEKPFAKQQIRIDRALSKDLPKITGSPAHLQQIFINLLSNARDAMPQGGIINIRTYPNDRCIVAEVRDSGTGIEEKIKEKIFEPFFTTKGVGRGTGLGLAVTYGIIKAHGGDIEVESALGKGALFRFRLPAESESHEARAT